MKQRAKVDRISRKNAPKDVDGDAEENLKKGEKEKEEEEDMSDGEQEEIEKKAEGEGGEEEGGGGGEEDDKEEDQRERGGHAVTHTNHDDREELLASHIGQRLERFDVRTFSMSSNWYKTFSTEFRRGSFLPKNSSGGNAFKEKVQGRVHSKDSQTWKTLPATHARFLHWIGFDPASALPPPTTETTEALAFLAYDAIGRIVEKSIMLM
jgi:hypothetical protein